ncbi:cupin domain-containing protein [Chitinophaga niabensis]|uniref:Cupin domain-containing protein n=1 Tax=Chitinophaga niabensis TaxID=536979 RepID=A0A1N6IWW6_9BACT|nr:cupin domain-containing protein [Chitinophaga niabensis]SIO36548.1 Cupin domain-containing protein [Chitinophaga niabensis]
MDLQKDQFRSYQGGYFRTLIAPDQTGNALALLELTLPQGAEPPAHIHNNEDESFYVVEGQVSVSVAGSATVLNPGEALFAPRNVPHSFRILTEKATIINLITPGTLWNYFIEFSSPIEGIPQIAIPSIAPPEDILKQMINVITDRYKVSFI